MTSAHPPVHVTLHLADPVTMPRWEQAAAASRCDAAPTSPETSASELSPDTLVLRVSPGLVPAPETIDALYDAWRADPSRPVAARVLPFDDGAHACLLGMARTLDDGVEPVEVPTAVVYAHVRADGEGNPVAAATPTGPDERRTPGRARHPAAEAATSIGQVLARVGATFAEPAPSAADCFLTVVTRTQGRRPQCLSETLLCLAGQTVRDFEVVLVRHRVTPEQRAVVDAIVGSQPGWLRERVRVVDLETGNRSAPLNLGFEQARGRYVTVLDDDDLVLSHWVESFRDLEQEHSGQLLRAGALHLPVLPDRSSGMLVAVPTGALETQWPTEFSLLDHLLVNRTPCMSVAFPRGVFAEAGLRFDEALDTTEDWDFLLQAAALAGVACTPEFTSIYRWWIGGESSHHEHGDSEWERNHDVVQRRLDEQILLMPRGTVTRLQQMMGEVEHIADVRAQHRETVAHLEEQIRDVHQTFAAEIAKVHESRQAHMEALERERARSESKNERLKTLRAKLRQQEEATSRLSAELEAAHKELEATKTSTAWRTISRWRRS